MQKFNFTYDKTTDDLFLYSPHSKSKGSVEIGDLILDFNSKKELVGLEFINATPFFKDILGDTEKIKEVLSDLLECKLDIKTKPNLLIIRITLSGKSFELEPVLSIPHIIETSPAIAV